MLIKRIYTAIILVLAILASLFLPFGLFSVLIFIILYVGTFEWSNLAGIETLQNKHIYCISVAVLFLLAVVFQEEIVGLIFRVSTVVFWFWIFLIPLLMRFPASRPLFRSTPLVAIIGPIILLSTATGLLWLESQKYGEWMVISLLLIVAIADIGAYFTGKRWGQKKLAPEISPGKTVEGVYGGLCANMVFAVVLLFTLNTAPEMSFFIVLTVLITSLFSVEGDLLESAIKRSRGVKDSGKILPGHGGVLDRIDGICAATPCFVFFALFFQVVSV